MEIMGQLIEYIMNGHVPGSGLLEFGVSCRMVDFGWIGKGNVVKILLNIIASGRLEMEEHNREGC